jgi:hypothetical protein
VRQALLEQQELVAHQVMGYLVKQDLRVLLAILDLKV